MDEPDFVGKWLRCFTANARWKKLKVNKTSEGENEIRLIFSYSMVRSSHKNLINGISKRIGSLIQVTHITTLKNNINI